MNKKIKKKEVDVSIQFVDEQKAGVEKLKVPQFAHYIGTSVPSVRGLIARREIHFFKFGKLILIPLSEAERILRDGYRPRQDSENAAQ